MKVNTNSNTYTIFYSVVVVMIVAFLLAFSSSALQERSAANERIDKKQQILAALNLRNIPKDEVEVLYNKVVIADEIINDTGDVLNQGIKKDNAGFKINRKEMNNAQLPLYICTINGDTKYVIPMVGKGLWGSIWGFISLNSNGKTVYGSYFSHESETAGLGALIKEEKFQDEFKDKLAYNDNQPVLSVMKAGKVTNPQTQCDGITGATLTTNGVNNMIYDYLSKYNAYFSKVSK